MEILPTSKPLEISCLLDAIPVRLTEYDIAWPLQIFEHGNFPDLKIIENSIYETGKKTKTWKFDTNIFSYITFLSNAAHAVAEEGKTIILSSHFSEIAQIIDKYVSKFLFGEDIKTFLYIG